MRRLEGFLEQLIDWEHPRHQPGALGLAGRHHASGQAHLHGLGPADGTGQALGAADPRQHAEGDFRQAETGVVGGVYEVAHQRQLAAAAQRVAGDRGDDRLAPRGDAVGLGEVVVVVDLRKLLVRQFLDVRAGGEGLARTGEDDAADLRIGLQAVEHLVEFADQLRVERIQRLGAVQGDQGDALLDLEQQGFVAHVHSPRLRAITRRWMSLVPS
ncbi:hypothetical protein D9M71_576800 [compost metagenome]